MPKHLAPELKRLVHASVAELGSVIREELGEKAYRRIEGVRRAMASTRGGSASRSLVAQRRVMRGFEGLRADERLEVARAFVLMLELMNACENAYRSLRLRDGAKSSREVRAKPARLPESIIYVLTAHPTEARSPESIRVFREIQRVLGRMLEGGGGTESREGELRHWIGIAWRTPLYRSRKPRVRDEAEHVYSILLREEVLRPILALSRDLCPIYARSWVGGDKDGHPGVDEKAFIESLGLSRGHLIDFCAGRLASLSRATEPLRAADLDRAIARFRAVLQGMRAMKTGDGARVRSARRRLRELTDTYQSRVHALHPELQELHQLVRMFPAFVVPMEFRESSDVLEGSPDGSGLAISRMLAALARVARGGDPRWYVRGFIVAMASEIAHVRLAARLVRRHLGALRIPLIPLLEQESALDAGGPLVDGMLADAGIRSAIDQHWGGALEIMVGYSDSAKEAGVLPSRRAIGRALHALSRRVRRQGVKPIFFQGSGGSVDRGGGTIREQTAWWPREALANYKVTLQGEMIERSMASPEIAVGQLRRIAECVGSSRPRASLPASRALDAFSARVAETYRARIRSPEFLDLVSRSTPYRFLDLLKIGSRPAKRRAALAVGGLRAIPWILCWTQTRVLFPTWWGVGAAWRASSPVERRELRAAFKKNPLFRSYVHALGFTLAKVELPVWRLYLERSGVPREIVERTWKEFSEELDQCRRFATAMLGSTDLLAPRPWLGESIRLRSPLIHPLNLLQILAFESRDLALIRTTVTGISAGMLTTG